MLVEAHDEERTVSGAGLVAETLFLAITESPMGESFLGLVRSRCQAAEGMNLGSARTCETVGSEGWAPALYMTHPSLDPQHLIDGLPSTFRIHF